MPYTTTSRAVRAERVLRHQRISVYHTYGDDDVGQEPNRYLFVTRPHDGEEDAFDVRVLNVPSVARLTSERPVRPDTFADFAARAAFDQAWRTWRTTGERAVIRAILREAIEAEEIGVAL